jgi:peptide/nickel transport system substrate-binding protein
MPFTWEPSYVSQVPVLHIEVQFPKSIKELQANSYKGSINGLQLDSRALIIDDYSSQNDRTVHFIVTNDMLTNLDERIQGDKGTAFTLSPIVKPKFPIDITSKDNKYIFELSWGPDIIETGSPTTFAMNIQDAGGGVLASSSFDFVLSQDNKEIYRQHLTSGIGDYSAQYTFAKPGTVTLTASNINGGGQASDASINLIVQQGSSNATTSSSSPTTQQKPSGCLIATAAFGSELTPQVQFLRNFRDYRIQSTVSGLAFMNTFNTIYYSFSPQVADYERGQPWLQGTVKAGLYPLIGILMISEKAYALAAGDTGSILAGMTASLLIGAVYLWPAGFAVSKKINNIILIVIAGIALAFLAITLIAIPVLLPISTAAFVIAVTGASAIAVAKAIRYVADIIVRNRQAS